MVYTKYLSVGRVKVNASPPQQASWPLHIVPITASSQPTTNGQRQKSNSILQTIREYDIMSWWCFNATYAGSALN